MILPTIMFQYIYYCSLISKIMHSGPGIMGNADFDSFCVFANLVEMDDEQLARLKRVVCKHNPSRPLYVFTIKNSIIIKGKAKMVINF